MGTAWLRRPDLEESRRQLFASLLRELGDERVVHAMERVPRELFVPESCRHLAYEDIPLPIGQGQTISQPFIAGLMTSALDLRPSDKVLELGTGSGYQAAVLAELADRVITLERVPELADAARARLDSLGYLTKVVVRLAGEELGCREEAPYDAILVTAGAPRLPKELLEQLAPGGRMVIPVGSREEQELLKVVKTSEGHSLKGLGPCRFVPLVGQGAWINPPLDRPSSLFEI